MKKGKPDAQVSKKRKEARKPLLIKEEDYKGVETKERPTP